MQPRGRLMGSAVGLGLLVALACSACGSTIPPPNERLAQSEGAMRSAQELGAQNNPEAALYLQLAREEDQQARRLIKDGDNDKASHMAMRSRVDAELSVMLAKEAWALTASDQARETLRKAKSVPMPKAPVQEPQPMPTP